MLSAESMAETELDANFDFLYNDLFTQDWSTFKKGFVEELISEYIRELLSFS